MKWSGTESFLKLKNHKSGAEGRMYGCLSIHWGQDVDRNPLLYSLLHSKSFLFLFVFSPPEASRGLYRTNPQPRNHENQSRVINAGLSAVEHVRVTVSNRAHFPAFSANNTVLKLDLKCHFNSDCNLVKSSSFNTQSNNPHKMLF